MYKTLNDISQFKTVKSNKNNFWLLELLYGYDAAIDKTAKFQIPSNITFKKIK